MKRSRIFVSSLAAVALLGTAACVTDPNTGERHVSRTGIGAVGGAGLGYLLGGLIGGKTARIVGAGIGGVAGGVIGYQLDQQIKELDEATAGSGVDVTQTPDGTGILVNLPDVTFAVDSTTISPSFRAALDEVAASLQKYPNSLVDVMGHTDSTGSDSYNLDLSRRRGRRVRPPADLQQARPARVRRAGHRAGDTRRGGRAAGRKGSAILHRRIERGRPEGRPLSLVLRKRISEPR